MDYLIGDTHFDDAGIMRMDRHDFNTVEEMNSTIMRSLVGNTCSMTVDDTLYHLGDVWDCSLTKEEYLKPEVKERIEEFLSKITAKTTVLILGNHDRIFDTDEENIEYWKDRGFGIVYAKPVLYNGFIILSHEPVYVNPNTPYKNIFAHVHGNLNYADVSVCGACVSVERKSMRYAAKRAADIIDEIRECEFLYNNPPTEKEGEKEND